MKLAIWIVTITIIFLVSLLAFGKLVFALALFLATLILSRGNIDWESLPSLGEPYSIPRYFMLITMVIFLIFFEAKPFSFSNRMAAVLIAGLFLLGISLYWLGIPLIVKFNAYVYSAITLMLLAGIPLLGTMALSKIKSLKEE